MTHGGDPVLYVLGGLPGTGKTTVSKALAQRIGAFYLRIDTIEQAIKAAGSGDVGPAGYAVAMKLAEENLRLGATVVADCVNPVTESRKGWRDAATRASARLIQVELVCSDTAEHRRRIESRCSDIAGHVLPTWEDVTRAGYETWKGEHLILDTAVLAPADAVRRILAEQPLPCT